MPGTRKWGIAAGACCRVSSTMRKLAKLHGIPSTLGKSWGADSMSFTDEDDDDDNPDHGETPTGYPPAVDLAWTILCNDMDGSKTPLRVHAAAVECLVRCLEGFRG